MEPAFKRQLEAKAKKQGITVSELLGNILRADIDEHGNESDSHPPDPISNPSAKYLLWFLLSFAVASASPADCFTGGVARVVDGDTIVVGTNIVRLAKIDATELGQPNGRASKMALELLVLNRVVVVHWRKRDRYRRLIGTLRINDTNTNHLLVRRGLAWHYRRYSRSELLAGLQAQAKADRVGLWKDREQIPPWKWRRKRRAR